MPSRREFLGTTLQGSSLLALTSTVPGFLARTARAAAPGHDGRVLVVIQLDGGNDGINTVVPYADEGYARHRSAIRLATNRLIKVDGHVGLHPSMGDAAKLLESGRLAIVPGVGYPNPSRSHFQSMATWQSARLDPEEQAGPGWLGRGLDAMTGVPDVSAAALFVGSGPPPVAVRGRRAVASALERIEDFTLDAGLRAVRETVVDLPGDGLSAFVSRSTLDAYATADRIAALGRGRDDARYRSTPVAERLGMVARLLKGGFPARVYYTTHGGYDTHAGQIPTHAGLLYELSGALLAFLDDLAGAGLAERVLVLIFSEFGRRVAENGSAGTDHGTAGPVLLAGPGVRAGLAGSYPSLSDLEDGDLRMAVDFRRVYATVLDGWLGLPSEDVLRGVFEHLPLLKG